MHNRYYSYINSATSIIEQYDGKLPLAIFLKQFFAANKKYGSKDRKQVSALCYHYYRVAKALPNESIEGRLLAATFFANMRRLFCWRICGRSGATISATQ